MEFHPVASIFPLMDGDEFESLKNDISANGLREPIVMHEGKIVDGRNRFRACELLGITPRTRVWDEPGSLVAYVVSLNLHRRHLTAGQKAMIAVEMLPHLEAEAKGRMQSAAVRAGVASGASRRGETNGTEKIPERSMPRVPQAKIIAGEARDQAAKLVGVNPHYVSDAKRIKSENPNLAAKIAAGNESISKAARSHREDKRETGTLRLRAPRKRPEAALPVSSGRTIEELIEHLYQLTLKPSIVIPFSEIKQVAAELRETYRKQYGSVSKGLDNGHS